MSNLKEIIASCGDATIVAATKYVDTFVMEELLANGINNFGENRVDSFLEKYDFVPSGKKRFLENYKDKILELMKEYL